MLLTEAIAAVGKTVDLQTLLSNLISWCIKSGWSIIAAIIIYVVGRYLMRLVMKLLKKFMERRHVEASIQTFLTSLASITMTILLAIIIVGRLGIETTSFAALIASAGVAIGMSMSGNLQNLAGGLIVLLLRPYKVGDVIESQGVSGTVKAIQIFHTILTTVDNKQIFIPNGSLSSGSIINYSSNGTRRLEWTVGVDYGTDYQRVETAIKRIIEADSRILSTPQPFIALSSLSESSVDFIIRVWVESKDYWNVNFDMNRHIYEEFNKEGINFPFPQLTVHKE